MSAMNVKLCRLVALAATFAASSAAVSAAEWVYPVRDASVTSLDGEWNFALSVNRPHDPAKPAYENPDTVLRTNGVIRVPGNWETQGYKFPQYGNQIQDLTGVYTRTFDWKPEWKGRKVMIRFDGVLFGYDVAVNGTTVAENVASAFNEHQFDVTSALREGANEIRVAVKTRAPGWLWDTNDCWCLAGIFRSVSIFSVPADGWIADVTFTSKADGTVSVKTDLGGRTDLGKVSVRIADVAGEGTVVTGKVANPKLWTPETPDLYALEVSYNGMTVREKVGIREISSDEKKIYVNGKPAFFRGVCWNEIMPKVGRAITRELRREQMRRMKEAGVNYIRTAHYPFGVDFYELADEMGFYVLDEVPAGSRGAGLLKDDRNLPLLIDRAERTIRRDKNRPCVFMWSFGNENAVRPNTLACLRYIKEKDPTRLRVLPQIWSALQPWADDPANEVVDVFSGHYLDGQRLAVCATFKKPFIQTEFAHACGNGFSIFEDRWTRTLRYDNFVGGSVWMWQDQAVETDGSFPWGFDADGNPITNGKVDKDKIRKVTKDVQGVWVDDKTFWDSDGDLGTDGVCYADGTPKESYYLMKRFYTAWPGLPKLSEKGRAELAGRAVPCAPEGITPLVLKPEQLLLRVGRKNTLLPQTQTINKDKDFLYWHPHLLTPRVLKRNDDGSWRIRWSKFDDPQQAQFVEGDVTLRADGTVSYDLKPSAGCKGIFAEAGLAVDLGPGCTRFDWAGLGPYTSTPGKRLHNDYGTWAKTTRDLYFEGNHADTVWAIVSDGSKGVMLSNADGSPFNACVENAGGRVVISKNDVELMIGGKSNRPGGSFAFTNVALKGEIRLSRVEGLKLPEARDFHPFKSTYGW